MEISPKLTEVYDVAVVTLFAISGAIINSYDFEMHYKDAIPFLKEAPNLVQQSLNFISTTLYGGLVGIGGKMVMEKSLENLLEKANIHFKRKPYTLQKDGA